MTELIHEALTGIIRQTAFDVHLYFGTGFLEKVYESSLVNRLRKKGLWVEQQQPIAVHDEDGTVVGDHVADLLVNNAVIVEVKAIKALSDEHVAQVLNYLKSTGCKVGLLINFASRKFVFKRLVFDLMRGPLCDDSALLGDLGG